MLVLLIILQDLNLPDERERDGEFDFCFINSIDWALHPDVWSSTISVKHLLEEHASSDPAWTRQAFVSLSVWQLIRMQQMEMFNWLRGGSQAHVYYFGKPTKHVPWGQRSPVSYWW